MKTVTSARVTRVFPLQERRLLMAHLASKDLDRDWLGPVDLWIGSSRVRMQCEGVGETGSEPAVMLRPVDRTFQVVQDLLTANGGLPSSPIYLERVLSSSAGEVKPWLGALGGGEE